MPRRSRLAVANIPWHIIQRGNNRVRQSGQSARAIRGNQGQVLNLELKMESVSDYYNNAEEILLN